MPNNSTTVTPREDTRGRKEDSMVEIQASDYAPRKLSPRQNVVRGSLLLAGMIALFGLLWLLDRLGTR